MRVHSPVSPTWRCVVYITMVLALSPRVALAGGLFGDALERLCGNCGLGRAFDDASEGIKHLVPPYQWAEEGGSRIIRESQVETFGPALAAAIRFSRNDAVAAGTFRIDPSLRTRLLRYFPGDLVDSVTYRIGQGNELSVQANAFRFGDASAVTLEDVIVFATPSDAQYNDVLWAHELTHVRQYRAWGLMDFAKTYVRDPGGVEREAYGVQAQYASLGSMTLEQLGVTIRNDTNQQITFLLRVGNGEWVRYDVGGAAVNVYGCTMCTTSTFGISIGTGGHEPIEYQLFPNRTYAIAWNDNRGVFDVFAR